jgi:hypothetical protein
MLRPSVRLRVGAALMMLATAKREKRKSIANVFILSVEVLMECWIRGICDSWNGRRRRRWINVNAKVCTVACRIRLRVDIEGTLYPSEMPGLRANQSRNEIFVCLSNAALPTVSSPSLVAQPHDSLVRMSFVSTGKEAFFSDAPSSRSQNCPKCATMAFL